MVCYRDHGRRKCCTCSSGYCPDYRQSAKKVVSDPSTTLTIPGFYRRMRRLVDSSIPIRGKKAHHILGSEAATLCQIINTSLGELGELGEMEWISVVKRNADAGGYGHDSDEEMDEDDDGDE